MQYTECSLYLELTGQRRRASLVIGKLSVTLSFCQYQRQVGSVMLYHNFKMEFRRYRLICFTASLVTWPWDWFISQPPLTSPPRDRPWLSSFWSSCTWYRVPAYQKLAQGMLPSCSNDTFVISFLSHPREDPFKRSCTFSERGFVAEADCRKEWTQFGDIPWKLLQSGIVL